MSSIHLQETQKHLLLVFLVTEILSPGKYRKNQENQAGNTEKNTNSISQITIDHIARLY